MAKAWQNNWSKFVDLIVDQMNSGATEETFEKLLAQKTVTWTGKLDETEFSSDGANASIDMPTAQALVDGRQIVLGNNLFLNLEEQDEEQWRQLPIGCDLTFSATFVNRAVVISKLDGDKVYVRFQFKNPKPISHTGGEQKKSTKDRSKPQKLKKGYLWEYSFQTESRNFGQKKQREKLVDIAEELTEEEIEAIREVFENHGIEGPEPEFEGYAVYGPKKERLRFRIYDLDDHEPIAGFSVEIAVRELTDETLQVIWDVAKAGNLALTNSVGRSVRILETKPTAKLLKRWPSVRSILSLSELKDWLINEIEGRQVRS